MRSPTIAAARIAATVVSGVALATIIGAGTAQASDPSAPPNCAIHWNAFNATVNCDDPGAPPGREYALIVECWGLHGIPNAFPFYAVGPYSQSSRSFVPTGQASANCSTNWGAPALNAGVITNAYVQVYRQ